MDKSKPPSIFTQYIDKIYSKSGYLDKYGGSVVGTTITLLIFFLLFAYHYVMNNVKPIKADWVNKRCSPAVMPFAGLINTPPGQSWIDFTASNFAACTGDILRESVKFFLEPIYLATDLVMDIFAEIAKSVQAIRDLFDYIRNQLSSITQEIMHRIANVLVSLQYIVIKLRTIINRGHGVLTATLFSFFAAFMSLKAFLGAFIEMIIIFLIVLAAAAVIMWILIFTWEIAIPMTALFVAIVIPFAICLYWFNKILDLTTSQSVPANPKCFPPGTLVEMINGSKPIEEVKVGEVTKSGAKVTGTMVLSGDGESIYNLHGTKVTGTHMIDDPVHGFVYVRDHPDAVLSKGETHATLYCLNTNDKRIHIGSDSFLDWDELDRDDEIRLANLTGITRRVNIHRYLDGGFQKDTLVKMADGRQCAINKIPLGSRLESGGCVIGRVCIDASGTANLRPYMIGAHIIEASPTVKVLIDDIGEIKCLGPTAEQSKGHTRLYHLLTTDKFFKIKGASFADYNGGLEHLLWPTQDRTTPFCDLGKLGTADFQFLSIKYV